MGRTYIVYCDLAVMYGLNEAIFIDYLQMHIEHIRSHDENFIDGHYWIKTSIKHLTNNIFPFWSASQMKLIINSLEKQGVIIVGNFNKNKFDDTQWLAFIDEERFLGPKYVPNKKTQEAI